MKLISTKEVTITQLRLPGDWRRFSKEPEVEARATTIQNTQPIVRASDKRLLAGKTEVAARQKLGLREVLVQLVECTDEEATAIELADASGSRQSLTAELVKQLAEDIMQAGGAERMDGQGPVKTAKGMARKVIADSEGVKPETVRMREYRAGKKKEPTDWTFDVLGMEVDPVWLERTLATRASLEVVIGKLQTAKGALTQLVNQGAELPQRVKHFQDDIANLSASLRGLRPRCLCGYCKGLGGVKEECVACGTLGYCTEAEYDNVPKEYWDQEMPIVLYRTKQVMVGTLVLDGVAKDGEVSEELWPG